MNIKPLPRRNKDAYKGNCGRLLVIAGSKSMPGAGALVCRSAMRSGAGLVTWAVGESLNSFAAILDIETVRLIVPQTIDFAPSIQAREHLLEASAEKDVTVMGSGLPVTGETGELMRLLTPELHGTLVLDAGGLVAVGVENILLKKRKTPTILTPHIGEMAALTGLSISEIRLNRKEVAEEYAKKTNTILVLKGSESVVTNGTDTHINTTGNPGMATAGMGDVLCGIIAALCGQKMDPFDAAVLAVYLHGLAGDIAIRDLGMHSLIATDMQTYIPKAFQHHEKECT